MTTSLGWVAMSPNIRSSILWRACICVCLFSMPAHYLEINICFFLKLSFAKLGNTSFLILQNFEFPNVEFIHHQAGIGRIYTNWKKFFE